jgi:hypothetical protein
MFTARLPKGIRRWHARSAVGGATREATKALASLTLTGWREPDERIAKADECAVFHEHGRTGTVAWRENRHQQRSDSDKGKNLAGDHGFVCPNQRLVAEWVGVQDVAD